MVETKKQGHSLARRVDQVMKINPVVKSIILILFAYVFLFLISYSTFLQIPVIPGENLVWQSVIEQTTTWIPFVLGFSLLFQKIRKNAKSNNPVIKENKLLLPSFFLIFLIGLSVGVHLSSQIIEDVLNKQRNPFVYNLAFFLDEQIGHLFIIPGILLSLILGLVEVNRENPQLNKVNKQIINLVGILTGSVAGILAVEAGSIFFLFIFGIVFLFYKYFKSIKKKNVQLLDYPFNRYLIILISVTTFFSIIWWSINGLSQPEEMGLHLFIIK